MSLKINSLSYPKEFESNYVLAVDPIFSKSFFDIIERSGRKSNITKMLEQRLRFLEERKHLVFNKADWFENVKRYNDIFVIKIKDANLNIRIPFVFFTYNQKEYAVLLSAFTETKHATAKTESYRSHMAAIMPIVNNLEEVFDREL